jgi:P27 family predicted phage terminase small subunit
MGDIQHVSNKRKRLQGHDRFIKNTPDTRPIEKLWRTPKSLDKYAKKFHREAGKLLVNAKVLTELDKYAWFELCNLFGHLANTNLILKREGYTIGAGDKAKKHPAATLYNELFRQFQGSCVKFGLTPADRKKIDLPVDNNPNDPTRKFLFGK